MTNGDSDQLEVAPTISICPDFELNILVNKDVILEPYPPDSLGRMNTSASGSNGTNQESR